MPCAGLPAPVAAPVNGWPLCALPLGDGLLSPRRAWSYAHPPLPCILWPMTNWEKDTEALSPVPSGGGGGQYDGSVSSPELHTR